jgi:Cu(I)/Ag(I) efflux system membrane fusion protein
MSRAFRVVAVSVALATAAGTGLWVGRHGVGLPAALRGHAPQLASMFPTYRTVSGAPKGFGPPVYYRDPDGRPSYALDPRMTVDGRPYRPVLASEDVHFEEVEAPAVVPVDGGSAPSRKILFYRNPMGLPDTSPVPKKDSMGMDYLPVYDGEADEPGVVKVSAGKMQRTGVRSDVVGRREIDRTIRVPGSIQLDERRVTIIAPRSESFLNKVENVTTGDHVRKGQPLLEFFAPDVNTAAAQLVAAPGFEGSRRRLRNLNISEAMIAEIERTRNVPLSIAWASPRDGIVIERNAIEGMRAAPGDVLFRIADVSVVWALADVPEVASGAVKIGQPVTVRVRSLPDRTFTGRIALIYPQINKETRTTRIRVELPNPDAVLLPEMYAETEIATGNPGAVLAVPDDAVIDNGTRKILLAEKGEGRFEPRVIETGARGGGYVEVTKGVAEGDRIVTSANFLIDAESNLKAALSAMAEPAPGEGRSGR